MIKLKAGNDVDKEIELLEQEVQNDSREMQVYTQLSKLYTAQRNYSRSTEILALAMQTLDWSLSPNNKSSY